MIGSDNDRRPGSRGFVPRGIGQHPTFRCWRREQTKSTAGSKLVGPLKLKHCAECVKQ